MYIYIYIYSIFLFSILDLTSEMIQHEQELDNAVAGMFAGVGARYTRMGCFNHALHNTVRDGLDTAGKRM